MTMKNSKLREIIREELSSIMSETMDERFVATIEFYVWGNNEFQAKEEAQRIADEINEKYDNSSDVVKIIPQKFGKIGQ